jgi:hypothetical protein
MRTRRRCPISLEGAVWNTRRRMKPPDDVTGITFSSKSVLRPLGSGASAVFSSAMGLARLALRRPTIASTKAWVSVEIGEVARPSQQQGVLERLLEMAVRAFDRAVLVRDAGVVGRRGHAVAAHQRRVALGDVFPRVGREVAERRRRAVAAMLLRRAAERP